MKKSIIIVGFLFLILGVTFTVNYVGKAGIFEKETSQNSNDTNRDSESIKEQLADLYSLKESDILLRDEISDILKDISDEEKEEDLDYDFEDIEQMLREDYSPLVAEMYHNGMYIDADLSDADNKQIMAELTKRITGARSVKNITNPIGNEYGVTAENNLKKVTEIGKEELREDREVIYTKDTDGFYDLGDVNIGYPFLSNKIDVEEDGTVTNKLNLYVYIDENIKKKDTKEFIDKVGKIKINGKKLKEGLDKYTLYYQEDNILDDFEDKNDIVFKENTVIEVGIDVPLIELFGENELSQQTDLNFKTNDSDEIDSIFDFVEKKLYKEGTDIIPIISINDNKINLDDKLKADIKSETGKKYESTGQHIEYEDNYYIKPEVLEE